MVEQRKPAYTANFDPEMHAMLSGDVRAEMARHRITIKRLATESGKGETTISQWLTKNTTQIRHDIMMNAIERLVQKEGSATG